MEEEKHRISYVLDTAYFELDKFDDMPTFLEIEVSDSNELLGLVKLRGYILIYIKPWSGKEVYEHYGIEYPRIGCINNPA